MPKPGRREQEPSDEIARFTDREDQRALFHQYLNSASEPPVVMFYGVGGVGKSWLLKKLRQETPTDVPLAILDFDPQAQGQRFVPDSAVALHDIRHQLDKPAPRFDLAFAMLRYKQGVASEPGLWIEVAAEVAGSLLPGVGPVLKRLSHHAHTRLKNTPLEPFLDGTNSNQFALELRAKTAQEIGNDLLHFRAALDPDQCEFLESRGHWAMRERPAEINQKIEAFLK